MESEKQVLNVKNLSFSYKSNTIFQDISFDMHPGEIIGLIAPNGTGKSTLLNLLAGNLNSEQQISLAGKTYVKDYAWMKKRIVKMLGPLDLVEELSGLDHLKVYADLWNTQDKIQEVIECLQLGTYVKKKIKTYSLGMRQRICFAMILMTTATFYLLDEVMNGLDIDNRQLISRILEQKRLDGVSIILASHLLDNLEDLANRVLFLKDKRIVLTHCLEETELTRVEMKSVNPQSLEAVKNLVNGRRDIKLFEKSHHQLTLEFKNVELVHDFLMYFMQHYEEFYKIEFIGDSLNTIYERLYKG